jgi:hypothetical protein
MKKQTFKGFWLEMQGTTKGALAMKRLMSLGLLMGVLVGGWAAPASADSWLDAMGEGSGVERHVAEVGATESAAVVPANIDLMRDAVANSVDRSFNFSQQVDTVRVNHVSIPSYSVGDGGPGGLGGDNDAPPED